jgi:cyclopropane fatty-acyl-phospholipid synthase-like methyltransferase
MPDEALRRLAHAGLVFNAPLSEARAHALVAALPIAPGARILDLGCGWGEFLCRAVAATTGTTGIGVDLDAYAVERGRRSAAGRSVAERVELRVGDATLFDGVADVVIAVGASHVWNGSEPALEALCRRVVPGGRILFGDGFWEREPGDAALEIFGDLPRFEAYPRFAESAALELERAERSSLEEWDDFESRWRSGLQRCADPEARQLAAEREADYRDVYRGVLGFAWLVLRKKDGAAVDPTAARSSPG